MDVVSLGVLIGAFVIGVLLRLLHLEYNDYKQAIQKFKKNRQEADQEYYDEMISHLNKLKSLAIEAEFYETVKIINEYLTTIRSNPSRLKEGRTMALILGSILCAATIEGAKIEGSTFDFRDTYDFALNKILGDFKNNLSKN